MKHGIGIGTIIGICLIFYWWMQDHPHQPAPVTQGYENILIVGTA